MVFIPPKFNTQAARIIRNARFFFFSGLIGIIDVKRNAPSKSIVLHVIQFSRTELNVPLRNGANKIQ